MPKSKCSSDLRQYGGISKIQRIEERRQKLLNSAFELFGTQGYAHTTVKGLCKHAGLNDRYFYESFQNMEQLLITLFQEKTDYLKQELVKIAMLYRHLPFKQHIELAIRTFFMEMQDQKFARITYTEGVGSSAEIDRVHLEQRRCFAQLLEFLINQNNYLDQMSHDQKRLISVGIGGAVNQMAVFWLMDGYQDSIDDLIKASTMMVCSLIGGNTIN